MAKLRSAELVEQAKKTTPSVTVEAMVRLAAEPGVVLVDIRDSSELAGGIIPQAIHADRGNLEFALDPESGLGNEGLFNADRLIMYCGSGGRSSLAAKLARDMGYDAYWLEGGFKAWKGKS